VTAVLRLARLEAVRAALSWRTPLLVVVLGPLLWFVMERPEYYPDPDGPGAVARTFIGDAVPYLWAIDQQLLIFFVLPAVLAVGSLVGDDRATGGPMTSVPRVGGPRGWWWAKVLTITALAAAFVALFAVLLLLAAAARGWELRTGASPYVGIDFGQRILAALPGRSTLGSTPLLLAAGWLQLVSILLIPAVVGLLTRNRVFAYAVPVALIVGGISVRASSTVNSWINPVGQVPGVQHDPRQVSPDDYVPWSGSIAVTCAWIAGLVLLGAYAARRTEL
jgi:hypothetical protein